MLHIFVFCKQKAAFAMRISDWGSDVCSSELPPSTRQRVGGGPDAQDRLRAHAGSGRRPCAGALAVRTRALGGPARRLFCATPGYLLDSEGLHRGIGMAAGNGSLSCVGMGMMLGAHIGPRARATIEQIGKAHV